MKSRTVVIAGAYGTGNLGDEAILVGMLKNLERKNFHRDCILVFSRDPQETESFHGVHARRRNLIDFLNASDVIIGGGELLQETNRMAFKYSVLGLASKLIGKRVVFSAIGVSNLRSKVTRSFVRLCLNLADGISVRDRQSALRLRALGVKKQVAVVNDPAFDLEPVSPVEAERLLSREGLDSKPLFLLGIASQHIRDPKINKAVKIFFLKFLETVLREHEHLQVVFLPFGSHKDDWFDRDILFANWLEDQLKNRRFRVIRNSYSPQQLLGLVGRLNLLVSTRFHPLLFASRMGVPAIGIRVYEKVESFCQDSGFPLVDLADDRLMLGIFNRHYTDALGY